MRATEFGRLSDRELLHKLFATAAQERDTTATLLALIAETDARRLYLPAGYPSMYQFCVHELHLSEDSAYKRIQAARAARQFHDLFAAVAKGRLHLSAVVLLAPHLTRENAQELVGAASHKTKTEIERLLAERFPRTELLSMVHELPACVHLPNGQVAPGQVQAHTPAPVEAFAGQPATARAEAPVPRSKLQPVAPQRFALQVMFDQSTHDDLQYLRTLLSHQVPSGDLALVLGRAMRLAIGQLEKQKFAVTRKPRHSPRRSSTNPRHIPAHVKRAVWERDQGMCTFTSDTGHRCGERKFLEYDHVDPVARGGQATVEGIRLRCRSHNQYEAECTFGSGFMHEKREGVRRAARESRARTAVEQAAAAAEQDTTAERNALAEARAASDRDVLAALRTLGFRANESREAAAFSATLADGPLEQRVRLALSYFRPKTRARMPAVASLGARDTPERLAL